VRNAITAEQFGVSRHDGSLAGADRETEQRIRAGKFPLRESHVQTAVLRDRSAVRLYCGRLEATSHVASFFRGPLTTRSAIRLWRDVRLTR
jgi:hypothetical protein